MMIAFKMLDNGVANSQSSDAGRETQTNTLLTGSRPGEGA